MVTYTTPNKYVYYNPNPKNKHDSGDCVIRAISKVMDKDWDSVYMGIAMHGGNNSYAGNYGRRNYNRSYMNRSYGDSKEEMMNELHEMMNEAKSDQERQAFQQFINQMQSM